jgi:hypothetical protein
MSAYLRRIKRVDDLTISIQNLETRQWIVWNLRDEFELGRITKPQTWLAKRL